MFRLKAVVEVITSLEVEGLVETTLVSTTAAPLATKALSMAVIESVMKLLKAVWPAPEPMVP